MGRKWIPPFIDAVVKVMYPRGSKRSCVLYAFTFTYFFAPSNCTSVMIHLHVPHRLFHAYLDKLPTGPLQSGETASQESNNSPTSTATTEAPSVSQGSTLTLYSSFKLPYHFSSEYLNNVSVKDASTLIGFENGWPSVFEVKEVTCQICGAPLGASNCHPGKRGNDILYTNLNPFQEVQVKVEECTSLECRAMHRVCPTEEGIILSFLNFCVPACKFYCVLNLVSLNPWQSKILESNLESLF